MKCLIYCSKDSSGWLKKFFPDIHPLIVNILNKPLLEYFIDFCVLQNIKDIRVIKNDPNNLLEDYFKDGTQWGVNISYSLAKENDEPKKLIQKNASFCKNNDIILFYGFFFPKYEKSKVPKLDISHFQNMKINAGNNSINIIADVKDVFAIDLSKQNIVEYHELSISKLESIEDYWNINMDILKNSAEDYYLPGYNNQKNEYLGKNIVFNPHTVEFQKPLMIGDNVQIKDNCRIGEYSIVGNNVIIDSASKIEKSIIYEQSYIGSDLEIKNKIVYRDFLIDPISGSMMQIVDEYFVAAIEKNILQSSLKKLRHRFVALLLLIFGALPFFIGSFIQIFSNIKWEKKKYFISPKLQVRSLPTFRISHSNFSSRFFIRFMLDKYPLLFAVLNGKLFLIGNQLLPKNNLNAKLIPKMKSYQPALFSYSEMFLTNFDDPEFLMHEMYYSHNKNFCFQFAIFFKTLINRFFNAENYLQKFFNNKNMEK